MWETQVQSLGWEDPLEKEMATHSSTLAWQIPWTEDPGRLQFTGSQRVRHDWATSLHISLSLFIRGEVGFKQTLNKMIKFHQANSVIHSHHQVLVLLKMILAIQLSFSSSDIDWWPQSVWDTSGPQLIFNWTPPWGKPSMFTGCVGCHCPHWAQMETITLICDQAVPCANLHQTPLTLHHTQLWLYSLPSGFPGGSDSKESACSAGDPGSVPGSQRCSGDNGCSLQYSCWENSMDRGAWWAAVYGVAKSQTQLSD